jgi:predicted O-methyltransferase YrrM
VKPHFPFHHPQIEAVLVREHAAADSDKWKLIPRLPEYFFASLSGRLNDPGFRRRVFSDVYSAVTPERGALLYLVARAIRATRIVEFGSSLGISTIYLAAAIQDNFAAGAAGPGQVIGSEMDPRKIEVATRNLQEAGLAEIVRILPGDALETLCDVPAQQDMIFLDGRKDMYLPVLKVLQPKLRAGAVVISDNIETFRKELVAFLDYMHSEKSGFASTTLKISDGMEISVLERADG